MTTSTKPNSESATPIVQPDYEFLTPHQQQLQQQLPPKWLLVSLMILLSIVPGLENTSVSPAIGQIQAEYGTDVVALQTFYLIGLAFGQLFWGPQLDRYGRKPIIIFCALLGITVNLLIVNATNGYQLFFLRLLQGFFFGGLGLAPAVILKDIFSTKDFVIYNSWIVLFFLYAPAIGPLFGGQIVVNLGWVWIFNILTIALIAVLLVIIWQLPETIDQQVKRKSNAWKEFKAVLKGYATILANSRARYLILFNIGYSMCIFSLPVLVPVLFIQEYDIHPDFIGVYLLFPLVSTLIGNRINVYFVKNNMSPRKVWINASVLQAISMIVNVIIGHLLLGPIGIIISFCSTLFFNGFQLGNIQSLYLMLFPEMTATAQSLLAFLRLFIPALVVNAVSHLPRYHGLTILHFDSIVIISCTLLTIYYAKRYQPYTGQQN